MAVVDLSQKQSIVYKSHHIRNEELALKVSEELNQFGIRAKKAIHIRVAPDTPLASSSMQASQYEIVLSPLLALEKSEVEGVLRELSLYDQDPLTHSEETLKVIYRKVIQDMGLGIHGCFQQDVFRHFLHVAKNHRKDEFDDVNNSRLKTKAF